MKNKRLWLTALAVIIADRVGKLLWAEADILLWPGVVALRGLRNTGMAFGLLQGNARILAACTVVLAAAVLFLLRNTRLSPLCAVAVGLMVGGAAGNMADRLIYGYVIDFIEPLFVRFFVFNIADAAVTCGALLLAGWLLLAKEH